jgi:outer membrane lipoprotein-sorting protein
MNRRPWPLFLLLLAGCPPRVDVRSVPPPDATALLAEVDAMDARVAALQSQAKAHVDARGKKGNVQMFVAASAPASVHLEVLDFFGKPSGILISDGRQFVMLASDTGTWLRGEATAENVSRVLPVSLPPDQLVAMLLGRAPRLSDPAPTLVADSEQNVFRVTLRAEGRTQELWVDPARRRVVRSHLDGPSAYTLTFDGFEDVRGAPFPRSITFAGAGSVALQYSDLRLGEQPDAALFTPQAPPGVPVEQIDTRAGSLP